MERINAIEVFELISWDYIEADFGDEHRILENVDRLQQLSFVSLFNIIWFENIPFWFDDPSVFHEILVQLQLGDSWLKDPRLENWKEVSFVEIVFALNLEEFAQIATVIPDKFFFDLVQFEVFVVKDS